MLRFYDTEAREALKERNRRLRQLEFEERRAKAQAALFATMDPEHVRLVLDDVRRLWAVETSGGKTRRRQEQGEADASGITLLARMANRMVYEAANGRLGTPLVLPPEVVRCYLSNPDARPRWFECDTCGYPVPGHGGTDDRPICYFARCPVCGGGVGFLAYYFRHRCRPIDRIGRNAAPARTPDRLPR